MTNIVKIYLGFHVRIFSIEISPNCASNKQEENVIERVTTPVVEERSNDNKEDSSMEQKAQDKKNENELEDEEDTEIQRFECYHYLNVVYSDIHGGEKVFNFIRFQ